MITFRHVFAARISLREALNADPRGFTADSIDAAIDMVDRHAVQYACDESGVPMKSMPNAAIGDGTIINAIINFFKSPQGQAIITALVNALIHVLVPAVP